MKFLIRIMQYLFSEQIKIIARIEAGQMEEKRIQDLFEKEMHFNYMRLRAYVGSPVMYFPNDLVNPAVGIATDIVKATALGQPCLLVYDYIKGEERAFTGLPIEYNSKTLEILMKLTPHERMVVLYRANPDLIAYRRPEGKLLNYDEVIETLTNNNFYRDIRRKEAVRQ